MFKISTVSEYGYRRILTYESEYFAEKDFQKFQNDNYVMVTFYENDKPIKQAEKINLKWRLYLLGRN